MEKARKKIRLTIEMYIDTDEYPNLTAKEVEQSIILQDSDVIDGFEITTCHPDLDNTSDFVLKNGVIVAKELISEVQSEEIDYKQEVIDSVGKEFKEYEESLLKRSSEEVYCHSYETAVKTELCDTIFVEVEFDDNVYKALHHEKGRILEGLYQDFIGQPNASVNSFEEAKIFIEDYCNRYYGEDILQNYPLAPQMGMG